MQGASTEEGVVLKVVGIPWALLDVQHTHHVLWGHRWMCPLCARNSWPLVDRLCSQSGTWFQVIGHTSVLAVSHCRLNPPSYMWWLQARKTVAKGPHKGFDALVRLIEWSLWKKRNRRIHEGSSLQSVALAPAILEEG
jgi:hypothetical protein